MISHALVALATSKTLMLWMVCLALLIFVAFFVLMVFWTSQRERAPLYQSLSQMPLKDEFFESVPTEVKS